MTPSRPLMAYFFLLAALAVFGCGSGGVARRGDREPHQPAVDNCPPQQPAGPPANSAPQAVAQPRRATRRLWVPMSVYDDPRERSSQQAPEVSGPSATRRALPPRIPNMSYEETDALMAEIHRNLRDGDIRPACERIYYVYYSNNDSSYIGPPVHMLNYAKCESIRADCMLFWGHASRF